MSTKDREAAAVKAIDHGFSDDERTCEDWRTLAIVHGLLAIAGAVDRLPRSGTSE